MRSAIYNLQIHSDNARKAATAWLMLGLASLVGAGVFSILLVVARTPVIQELAPLVDFFRVALVIHVNLSVLIWLLSMAGMLWSLASTRDKPVWDRFSFFLAASGTAVVIFSPFIGAADPLMNNYVPLLRHPVFYAGLILFTSGIASHLLRSVTTSGRSLAGLDGHSVLQIGITLSGQPRSICSRRARARTEHQLHHLPRWIHPRRSGRLRSQAQYRQRGEE